MALHWVSAIISRLLLIISRKVYILLTSSSKTSAQSISYFKPKDSGHRYFETWYKRKWVVNIFVYTVLPGFHRFWKRYEMIINCMHKTLQLTSLEVSFAIYRNTEKQTRWLEYSHVNVCGKVRNIFRVFNFNLLQNNIDSTSQMWNNLFLFVLKLPEIFTSKQRMKLRAFQKMSCKYQKTLNSGQVLWEVIWNARSNVSKLYWFSW